MAELPLHQKSYENPAPVRLRDDVDQAIDDADRPMKGSGSPMPSEEEMNRQLLASDQCARLDHEWQAIQATFVDSPRASVEKADELVSKTIDTIAASFADMRNSLETTWEKNGEVSTEDLRLALQNYRSFFRRLLSV